jgi:hypothetical protein
MSVLFHNSGLNLFLGLRKEVAADGNNTIEKYFLQQPQMLVLFFWSDSEKQF